MMRTKLMSVPALSMVGLILMNFLTRGRAIRLPLVLALAMTAIALNPQAVRADEQGAFKGTLTVQFTLSTRCASGDSTCSRCVQTPSGVFVEAQGIAVTTLGLSSPRF